MGKISFSAVGDVMLLKALPQYTDFDSITRFINKADVRLCNLEMVVSDDALYASAYCGGQWIKAATNRLQELLTFGFNCCACANNHSMDYSYDGLESTMSELIKLHVPYCGIGHDLKSASQCASLVLNDTSKTSVSIFSITSTFNDAARAGDSNEHCMGRPGVNALRTQFCYNINERQLETLKDIAKNTYINGERDNARNNGFLPPEPVDAFNFGGIHFTAKDGEESKKSICNLYDLNRMMQSIAEARKNTDYVIVMAHSHQIKRDLWTEPDYFFEDFCRACIDAGAHAVIGSGTHQLKPIEIYKNRPIFYSLGNFIFQLHHVSSLPIDFWEKYNLDFNDGLPEAILKKNKNSIIVSGGGGVGLEFDRQNYISTIPYFEFEDDTMTALYLKPIELGFTMGNDLKGLPFEANQELSHMIVNHINRISKAYNTKAYLCDSMIRIGW
jgi:poly-gamma-glutamate synthesis protein (capsule biosynthesis protein)